MSRIINFAARLVALLTRRLHPRGTQRLLRLAFSPKRMSLVTVIPYADTLKIHVDTSTYVEWELFFFGTYEERSINIIKKIIKQSDIALDAGAHIGTHTLVMADRAGKEGRVFAFDPEPGSIRCLTENINLNGLHNVRVFQKGLSDKQGELTLRSWSSEMINHGTASFYELPNLVETEVQVPVTTIDSVVVEERLNRLNFVKINTRGSDLPIIRGAQNSLKVLRPYLLFEFNEDNWSKAGATWDEMKQLLDSLGYLLYRVNVKGLYKIESKPSEPTSHNIFTVPNSKNEEVAPFVIQ